MKCIYFVVVSSTVGESQQSCHVPDPPTAIPMSPIWGPTDEHSIAKHEHPRPSLPQTSATDMLQTMQPKIPVYSSRPEQIHPRLMRRIL